MATMTDRLGRALERETPQWGIRPVPTALRRLSGLDLAVLWGDLSIGLLVLAAGALLVPALGLPRAVAAIVIGSLVGSLPLAAIGLAGARESVPAMVLFRPVLGRRGSFAPSAANLVQLVGWTAFEFWAMAAVADAVGRDLFGVEARLPWLALVAAVCTSLALAGPIFAVRRWLERFGAWVVAGVSLWLTIRLLTNGNLAAAWSRPGEGGLPFWLAVDLVIAMPVSWLPLVADFNRFARSPRGAFVGTFWSYSIGNAWFYTLGALLVLTAGATPGVVDLGTAIAASAGGAVVLLALLAGESDQAMANVYSAALSVQNVRPALSQRGLILGLGGAGLVIAAAIGDDAASTFEFFLFLIGSVFVPLFGVFLADWGIRARGRFGPEALFEDAPDGVRWQAIASWACGFVVYQWCAPTGPDWWTSAVERVIGGLGLPFPLVPNSALGASLPGFVAAFAVAMLVLPRRGAQT